jgi:hypothetical protein
MALLPHQEARDELAGKLRAYMAAAKMAPADFNQKVLPTGRGNPALYTWLRGISSPRGVSVGRLLKATIPGVDIALLDRCAASKAKANGPAEPVTADPLDGRTPVIVHARSPRVINAERAATNETRSSLTFSAHDDGSVSVRLLYRTQDIARAHQIFAWLAEQKVDHGT